MTITHNLESLDGGLHEDVYHPELPVGASEDDLGDYVRMLHQELYYDSDIKEILLVEVLRHLLALERTPQ